MLLVYPFYTSDSQKYGNETFFYEPFVFFFQLVTNWQGLLSTKLQGSCPKKKGYRIGLQVMQFISLLLFVNELYYSVCNDSLLLSINMKCKIDWTIIFWKTDIIYLFLFMLCTFFTLLKIVISSTKAQHNSLWQYCLITYKLQVIMTVQYLMYIL